MSKSRWSGRLAGNLFWPALALVLSLFLQPAAAADLVSIEKSSNQVARWIVFIIEMLGAGVIVLGVMVSFYYFLADVLGRRSIVLGYHDFRAKLGRAILLGLEFLVAADIINTVAIETTFESLGALAIVILIRVFLSFALEVEIDGKWPWQRGARL